MVRIFNESEDQILGHDIDPVQVISDIRVILEDGMVKNTTVWDSLTAAVDQLAIVSKFFRDNP